VDFSFDEVQEDVRGLARKLVEGRVTPSRLRELEAGLDRMDRDLWAELAAANLLGLCLPERDGGSGYGVLEAVVVLEELGRQPPDVLLDLVEGEVHYFLWKLGVRFSAKALGPSLASCEPNTARP